tara:strand:- start:924 stop:1406 length:483 start_codon:yes stop_codon:yes gene_type:complete
MDDEYINKITLECLLNPLLQTKLKTITNSTTIFEDINFYKKRINQVTKDMIKGDYPNNELKQSFLSYSEDLIYYFKQLDEKDIYQKDYLDISFNKRKKNLDISCNLDNFLINQQEPKNNLDNFVNRLPSIPEEKIIPHKKIINIKDPSLRTKGVKKNNIQ